MEQKYRQMAKRALDDLYARYWTDADGGHILPTHCGVVVDRPRMIWETAMLLIAMETYYDATGDEETAKRIAATWRYLKTCFTYEQMAAGFGQEPNLALDDTGWDIMTYWMAWRFTGDPTALRLVRECTLGAYAHFKDGTLENGCWYNDWAQYNDQWKSSYIVSLLLTALKYCRDRKGTEQESAELLEQTLTLCRWVERDFRRDRCQAFRCGRQDGGDYTVDVTDNLYWIDYNKDRENKPERFGPSGGTRQNDIFELGSVSALFANMGMAALNVTLSEMLGDPAAMKRALETSASIERVYNLNGAYLNDRDPHTDATMLRDYVHTILATDRATDAQRDMLFRTADHIFENGQNSGGLYYPWWSCVLRPGEPIPERYARCKPLVENMMVNATSVTMICGAALLEKYGFAPGVPAGSARRSEECE